MFRGVAEMYSAKEICGKLTLTCLSYITTKNAQGNKVNCGFRI